MNKDILSGVNVRLIKVLLLAIASIFILSESLAETSREEGAKDISSSSTSAAVTETPISSSNLVQSNIEPSTVPHNTVTQNTVTQNTAPQNTMATPLPSIVPTVTDSPSTSPTSSIPQAKVAVLPEVIAITPAGEEVEPGSQIVFKFNTPMVDLAHRGQVKEALPITITPAVDCDYNWIDAKTLACNIKGSTDTKTAKTKLGTKYKITVAKTFKNQAGESLAKDFAHEFVTSTPTIGYTYFISWDSPVTPLFGLKFNDEMKPETVKRSLFFVDEKNNKKRVSIEPSKIQGEVNRTFYVSPKDELEPGTFYKLVAEPGLEYLEGTETNKKELLAKSFYTIGEFKFLGVSCSGFNPYETVLITKENNNQLSCRPEEPISMVFSSPVIPEGMVNGIGIEPSIPANKDWKNYAHKLRALISENAPYTSEITLYKIKPEQDYKIKLDKTKVEDQFGRSLVEDVDFTFKVSSRDPRLALKTNYAVIEKDLKTDFPVYVQNLDDYDLEFVSFTSSGLKPIQKRNTKVENIRNVSYAVPLGVRELLGASSGILRGRLINRFSDSSDRVLDRRESFIVNVTPYAAHVKVGRFNTLVWVSSMSDGKPVADAKVKVFKANLTIGFDEFLYTNKKDPYSFFQKNKLVKPLFIVKTDKNGLAVLPGKNILDSKSEVDYGVDFTRAASREKSLIYLVEKDGDMTMIPTINELKIETRTGTNNYIPESYEEKFIEAWGFTAQGVYKLGDKVDYKIFFRSRDNKELILPGSIPLKLKVEDPLGVEIYKEENLKLTEFGSYAGSFLIPKTSAAGDFKVVVESASFPKQRLTPISLLVSDFNPAPFKVTVALDKPKYYVGDKLTIKTESLLYSGGPFISAPVNIKASITDSSIFYETREFKGYNFYFSDNRCREGSLPVISPETSKLDAQGQSIITKEIQDKEVNCPYASIYLESAVTDDRGKSIVASRTVPYFGRDRFVGIKTMRGDNKINEPLNFEIIVIDDNFKPVSGTEIEVKIKFKEVLAARVKGAGDAYLTTYVTKGKKVHTCKVVSTLEPVKCDFTPVKGGEYIIEAKIKDTKGRSLKVVSERYIYEPGFTNLWESEPKNTFPVTIKERNLKVGEQAEVQIKNPLPGARALITIEREGVIDYWTETFNDSLQTLKFPIKPDYLPGFYLSITLFSPRVEKPFEGKVDLGKPVTKLTYEKFSVNTDYKKISFEVTPEKPVYKPREKVKLRFQLQDPQKAGRTELAVSVLDKSIFDLINEGENYFDPLKGMYKSSSLGVRNYSVVSRILGRIKFEKKGASPGGDGSFYDKDMRTIEKFVAYWNPSVVLDKSGKGEIEFEAPDNLTEWQVFAVALNKKDFFGLSSAGKFKVNKEIEIQAALPNVLRDGDEFTAKFTVMNRSEKLRKIKVKIHAEGAIEKSSTGEGTDSEVMIEAEPFVRKPVFLNLKAFTKKVKDELVLKILAEDTENQSEDSKDSLSSKIPVHERLSTKTTAQYGDTTESSTAIKFSLPESVRTDRGDLTISLAPSLITGLEGTFSYALEYPYACWEQKLTKALAASSYLSLKGYLDPSFKWEGAEKLITDTLKEAKLYQGSSGAFGYWGSEAVHTDLYLSAFTGLSIIWLSEEGREYQIETGILDKLKTYLKAVLTSQITPKDPSKNHPDKNHPGKKLLQTLRPVVAYVLIKLNNINGSKEEKESLAKELLRLGSELTEMSLFAKSFYLDALNEYLVETKTPSPEYQELQKKVIQAIISNSVESSGKISFNEELESYFDAILSSRLRTNCKILDSLNLISMLSKNQSFLSDSLSFVNEYSPKLVKFIIDARKDKFHWENTQENIFCTRALATYSSEKKAEKPNYKVVTKLNEQSFSEVSFSSYRDKPQVFSRETKDFGSADFGSAKDQSLKFEKTGVGRLYYTARLTMADKVFKQEAANVGFDIQREYLIKKDNKWQKLTPPYKIKQGDLVRVNLYLKVPTKRNFVVVDDPIPAGLEPLNTQLKTTAQLDAYDVVLPNFPSEPLDVYENNWVTKDEGIYGFYHTELRHDFARFFADNLNPRSYELTYTAQAIAKGKFTVMATKVLEMYQPETYGQTTNEELIVE